MTGSEILLELRSQSWKVLRGSKTSGNVRSSCQRDRKQYHWGNYTRLLHSHRSEVAINPDKSVPISDNGRGISSAINPVTEKSFLERVITSLRAFRLKFPFDKKVWIMPRKAFGDFDELVDWIQIKRIPSQSIALCCTWVGSVILSKVKSLP